MATKLSSDERTLRAKVAAHSLHASTDPRETTAHARVAFLAKFEDQVDPDRTLPEVERKRRAEQAMKAHMSRLALERSRKSREVPELRVEREYQEIDAEDLAERIARALKPLLTEPAEVRG